MPDKTINVKHNINSSSNDTTRGGGKSSTFDKKLTGELQKLPKELQKSIKKGMTDALSDILKGVKSKSSSTESLNKKDLENAFKSANSDIVRKIVSVLSSAAKSTKSDTGDLSKLEKTMKDVDKHVESGLRVLSNTIEKKGFGGISEGRIKSTTKSVSSNIQSIIPKNFFKALNNLSTSLDSTAKKIDKLDKTIASLRNIRMSGKGESTSGGISLNEIKSFVTAVKDIVSLFSGLKNDFKDMRQSAKEISGSNKELYKNLSGLISKGKESVRGKVSRATERVKDDPKQIATLIAREISKIPALKNTTVGKVAGSAPDIDKLASSFKDLSNELKRQVKEKKISVEGIDELTKSMNQLLSNFKNVAKVGSTGDKKIDVAINKIDSFMSKINKMSIDKKTIFDKPVQIPIDKKKLQNDIEDILNKINPKIKIDRDSLRKELELIKKDYGIINPHNIKARQRIIKETGGTSSVLDLSAVTQVLEKAVREAYQKTLPDFKSMAKEVFDSYKDAVGKLPDAVSKALKEAYKSGSPAEILKVTNRPDIPSTDSNLVIVVKSLREAVVALQNSTAITVASEAKPGTSSVDINKSVNAAFKRLITNAGDLANNIDKTKKSMDPTGLSESIVKVKDKFEGLSDEVDNVRKAAQSSAMEFKKITSTNSMLSRYKPQVSYREGNIIPSPTGDIQPFSKGFTKVGKSFQDSVNKRAQELSKSLDKLQGDIINTLESSFKQTQSGWSVVKDKGKPANFKLAGEGSAGDRQWRLDIANVNALKKILKKSPKSADSPAQLIKEFKETFTTRITSRATEDKQISTRISEWLKLSSESAIEDLRDQFGDSIVDGLKDVKVSYSGSTEVGKKMKEDVVNVLNKSMSTAQSVFRETYGKIAAQRELSQKGLVKSIALPAAKVSEGGDVQFKTLHGSKRSIPKFATFKTGFEQIYDTLLQFNKITPKTDYSEKIRQVGLRPTTGSELESAGKLAEKMLKDLGNIPEMKGGIVEQYKAAATSKGLELQKSGIGSVVEFEKRISEAIKTHTSAVSSGNLEKGINNFIKSMDAAGLSAYDFVKSMDAVKFENIYDIIGKVLKGGQSLTGIAKGGAKESSIRKYENIISEIEGLMPVLPAGRPRRGLHMENIVNMMSQTSPAFETSTAGGVDFEKQKRVIKDLNIRLGELVQESKELRELGPADVGMTRKISPIRGGEVPTISTLGVPEHQASRYEEFRKSYGDKVLGPLNAVVTKMYTENLTELAPFGAQFNQLGRNISNVTNALSSSKVDMAKLGVEGITTEFPALRTEKERNIIESGRYGKEGYGFNVLAELRHTAGTFEDQVLISGKLATALTQATSNLVGPSAMGRISDEKDTEAMIRGAGVSEIKTGLVKDIDAEISKTLSTFQEILGEPEKYKGRADKALISDVKKTISVVRGADVEVQTAKLAEVFMNYLGRKIVTRYGSKGVGITPTGVGPDVDIRSILQKYGGAGVKVMTDRESAGLGTAVMPKNMGKLASEIIGNFSDKLKSAGMAKSDIESLKTDLSKSGNKFIIDMFKKPSMGVVAKEGAATQSKIFDKYKDVMQKIFGEGLEIKSDSEGIRQLKSVYSEFYKSKGIVPKLYEEKPIDVRISAYGAGKRGLQPEVLESVMNNIIGSSMSATTLKTTFDKPVYERMLGRTGEEGELSKYSRALGYKTTVPGGAGGAVHSKLIDEIGKKAADLEAVSNFYVDVIDEFGKMRKSLVGEKFVQIVEEPGETKEWEKQEIERGKKGEKLNIPAFAAYQTIFGETSEFMKEINASSTLDTSKYFEYIKALQAMNSEIPELKNTILSNLPLVELSELQKFEARTGTKGTSKGSPRSLTSTVLDVSKFPSAFKTEIPSTVDPRRKQEFYVPGALARGTYPEPLIAGEYGMDQISRRLQTVVNMAKNLEDALKPVEGAEIKESIKKGVGGLTGEAWGIARGGKPGGVQRQKEIYDLITSVLSTTITPDPNLRLGSGLSERTNVEEFLKKQLSKKKPEEAYATAIGRASDIAVGKQPGRATPEELKAVSVLDRAVSQGRGKDFAAALKMEAINEQKIQKSVAALERSKIDYYNSLAEAVLGKKGGVAEVLFTRKIPAVMSKAVNATVDKTDDLRKFSSTLKGLSSEFESISGDYGLEEFTHIAGEVDSINKEHSKKVSRLKESGVPVLKQHELGIHPSMAKKLPVEFSKRFKILENAGETFIKKTADPEKTSGSLYDLIKYTEQLQDVTKGGMVGSDTIKAIEDHIENELVPYIESVRYPFTGTASVQPYKPKLLYPKKGQRDIGKNVLTVPGMPEMDLESFDKVLSKVKEKRGVLEEARTTAFGAGDVEKANKLTKIIDQLNIAISNVIPKYIAHQQKLDYDGDAIEIHTAVTNKARQDIKKHFDSLNKDVDSTAGVFRDAFTYEAIQKPTGKYPLADMMQAFEKKFDPEKGFEFLKKPFLTRELEYLKPSEQLDILSKRPGMEKSSAEDVKAILKGTAQKVLKSSEDYESISKVISSVKPEMDESSSSYANKVMSVINDSSKVNKEAAGLIKSGIRTRLFEEKFADTIEAQLYKLHTGAEVESVNRVQRIVESSIGFGGGMIGKTGKLSGGMAKRYPADLKSFGGNVGKEIHTQLNEIVRFAQQKGMDVKHAGEKPVAGEMIKALSMGTEGAGDLWKQIQEDKTYGELKDFADANEESIKRRLEALPTEDVRKEATQLAQMRGGDVTQISGYMGREELISQVVKELGLEGFLKELAIQIEEAAVVGLSSKLKSMSPEQRSKIMKSAADMDIDTYAIKAIQAEQKKSGINIKKHITDVQQPIYGLRSYSASTGNVYKRYTEKTGKDIQDQSFGFYGMKEGRKEAYTDKYKKAQAVAMDLYENLRMASSSDEGSAYSRMLISSIDRLYDDYEKVNNIVGSLGDYNVAIKRDIESVASRITKGSDLPEISKGILGKSTDISPEFINNMNKQVDELSKLAGVPSLDKEQARKIEVGTDAMSIFSQSAEKLAASSGLTVGSEEYEQKVSEFVESSMEKAKALLQLDKILMVLKVKSSEFDVIKTIIPKGKLSKGPTGVSSYKPQQYESTGRFEQFMSTQGGVKGTKGPGWYAEQTPKGGKYDQYSYLEELVEKATGGLNKLKGATYESIYRASGLHGGGKFGISKPKLEDETARFETQINSIVESMTGKEPKGFKKHLLKSSATLGTGLHSKIEKIQKERYGDKYHSETLVMLKDEIGGMITGHIDSILRTAAGTPEKVMDVKTVGKSIVSDVGVGKTVSYKDLNVTNKTRQKIEDAMSQVNFYLKALASQEGYRAEDIKGEIQFYDRLDPENWASVEFDYDPERYVRDMKAIAEARKRIESMSSLGKGKSRYAKTGSVKQLKEHYKKQQAGEFEMSDSEIEAIITGGMDYFKSVIGRKSPAGISKSEEGSIREGIERAKETVKKQRGPSKIKKKIRKPDLEQYMVPPPIVEGDDLEAVFENLKSFHEEAKAFQLQHKGLGVGTFDFDSLHKKVKSALSDVSKKGPQGKKFMETVNILKETGDITDSDILKAWKYYRIAVGDFFITQAEEAKNTANELNAAGDITGARSAYKNFERSVGQMQSTVHRGLGKTTDIYTEGRRYIDPELAKGAGVFINPRQLLERAKGSLGDDEQLRSIFKNMVGDTMGSGGKMKAPIVKAREAFKDITGYDDDLVDLLTDAEKLKKLGPEVIEAWDLTGMVDKITRLRESMQQFLRFNFLEDFEAPQRKNIQNTIGFLKNIETMYTPFDLEQSTKKGGPGEWGEMGIVRVPKWEAPKTQEAMHKRNLQRVSEYFGKAEEAGGPKKGERFTYMTKIFDQAGNVVKNRAYDFEKYGESVNAAGEKVGYFSSKQRDLISIMQGSGRGFKAAITRAAKWGAASTIVYGGFSKLKESVGTLAEIETGLAQLRMVMPAVSTDFEMMAQSAIGFGKQYGVSINDVLKSMKIFAQQGLSQAEVIERTQTATLASNVTTLSATDATEALTAAMKVFRQEGESSMRFMDAWSEVEAKHAITAGDMANGLKKAAAAAKNAGIDFDELNGMIAAIGSVTRQTGKEVGTSMRFIFRRLTTEKGPKELAKLQIPVQEGPELRGGFDILADLAGKWDDLTSAQRMNIAQSIGGTRQYNSLLVLMDNWDEALSAIKDSTNSKGSAERRNLELMKTYTKQLEQTKAAATELQVSFGKIALPVFKGVLKGTRLLLEFFSSIPNSVKLAGVAIAGFFGFMAKGGSLVEMLVGNYRSGKSMFSDVFDSVKKEWATTKYEIFGKGSNETVKTPSGTRDLLKTIAPVEGKEQGKSLRDFQTSLGKTMFIVRNTGMAYNQFIGNMVSKTADGTKVMGEAIEGLGDKVADFGAAQTLEAAGGALVSGGLDLKSITQGVLGIGAYATGKSSEIAGSAVVGISEKLGPVAGSFAENWANENTNLVKSIAPLVGTVYALYQGLGAANGYYNRITMSANEFEKAIYGVRRANEAQLSSIRDTGKDYDRLQNRFERVNKARDPKVKTRRQELGTYESPILGLAKIQKDSINVANTLAETNVNLVSGYDKLGNAVLKTTDNFKNFIKIAERTKLKEIAKTELDVAARYVQDLTDISGPEEWKSELKSLLGEFPVVGEMLAKHIKVSPAKALDTIGGKLNDVFALKNKFPLSTAADKDIKDLQGKLKKVRESFNSTYVDFRKTISNISTEGLSKEEISDIFTDQRLTEGYKLIIDIEPEFRFIGKGKTGTRFNFREGVEEEWSSTVNWKDVAGSEVLKRSYKGLRSAIGATSSLTKANLETEGFKPRQPGDEFKSGDVVTFIDEAVKEFDVAGKQAIVEYKKTIDGIYEWTATYFNRKTMKIEERSFSEMMPLVDQVFPVRQIQSEIEDRVDTLNEFVAGASAGLRGITKKDFKRDFSLGERFFSETPTTTILQGSKGYSPSTGFGESPFQRGWGEDIKKYFFKPMREYRLKIEQVGNLRREGLEGEKATIGKGFIEEIEKLQTILKNNQVVFQFRAAFVDLTKAISEGSRALKENLAIERNRVQLQKDVSGYMRGVPTGLDNINLGVRKYEDLSTTQLSLKESPAFRLSAERFKEIDITRGALEDQINNADKAAIAVKEISSTAKGFGTQLSPEDLSKYVEEIFKGGNEETAKLTVQTSKVVDNTAQTVDRLDRILANTGDAESIDNLLSKWTDAINIANRDGSKQTEALSRLSGIRKGATGRGDSETVLKANKAIDIIVKNMANEFGLSGALGKLRQRENTVAGVLGSSSISENEFMQRAFAGSGLSSKEITQEFAKYLPEKKWYKPWSYDKKDFSDNVKDLRDLQEDNNKQSWFSDKQMLKTQTAMATYTALNSRYSNSLVDKYDEQLAKTDKDISKAKQSGKGPKVMEDLLKERSTIIRAKEDEESSAKLYGTVATMGAMGAGIAELAKIFGLTEGQIKAVGVSTMGLYAAFKTASSVIGTEMPESVKAYGKELEGVVRNVAKGEKPSISDLKDLGTRMQEDYKKAKKSKVDKKFERQVKDIDYTEIQKNLKEGKYDKEISDNTKKLQEQMGKNVNPQELQKLIAAYVVAGLTGYVAEKGSDRTKLSTLESKMEKESKAMVDAMVRNEGAFDAFYKDLSNRTKEAGDSGLIRETVPQTMDVDREVKTVLDNIDQQKNRLVEIYKELADEQSKLADAMYQAQLGSRIREVTADLKASLRDMAAAQSVDMMPVMKRFRDNMDSLFGGSHPNAPIPISIEDMRRASKVGENLVTGKSTKYDLERSQLKYDLYYGGGDVKSKAAQRRRLADLPDQQRLDIEGRERSRQVGFLTEQTAPYEKYMKDLEQIKLQPGVSQDLREEITEIQKQISSLLEGASAEISKEDKLGLSRDKFGWKSYLPFTEAGEDYNKSKKRIEAAGDLQYRGIEDFDLTDVDSRLQEIYVALEKRQSESQIALQKEAIELGISPMVDQQIITNSLLDKLVGKDTDESSFGKEGHPYALRVERYKDEGQPRASGGRIFGEGGPREDKVPAYLSPGEFVIRAASAQRIGYGALSHMNKKGAVPSFADGGSTEWTEEDEKNFAKEFKKAEELSTKKSSITEKIMDFFSRGAYGRDFDKEYRPIGLPKDKSSQYVQLNKLKEQGFADGGMTQSEQLAILKRDDEVKSKEMAKQLSKTTIVDSDLPKKVSTEWTEEDEKNFAAEFEKAKRFTEKSKKESWWQRTKKRFGFADGGMTQSEQLAILKRDEKIDKQKAKQLTEKPSVGTDSSLPESSRTYWTEEDEKKYDELFKDATRRTKESKKPSWWKRTKKHFGFADGGSTEWTEEDEKNFAKEFKKAEELSTKKSSITEKIMDFFSRGAYGRDFDKEYRPIGLPKDKSSQYVQLNKLKEQGFADGGMINIGSDVSKEDREEILNWLKRDKLKEKPFGSLVGIPSRFTRSPMGLSEVNDVKDETKINAPWHTYGQKPFVDKMVLANRLKSEKRLAASQEEKEKFKQRLLDKQSKLSGYKTSDEFMRNLPAEFFTKSGTYSELQTEEAKREYLDRMSKVKAEHEKAAGFKFEYDERRGLFIDSATGMGRIAKSAPLSYSPIDKPTNVGVHRMIDSPSYLKSKPYKERQLEKDKLSNLISSAADPNIDLGQFDAGTKALLDSYRKIQELKENKQSVISMLRKRHADDKKGFDKQVKMLYGDPKKARMAQAFDLASSDFISPTDMWLKAAASDVGDYTEDVGSPGRRLELMKEGIEEQKKLYKEEAKAQKDTLRDKYGLLSYVPLTEDASEYKKRANTIDEKLKEALKNPKKYMDVGKVYRNKLEDEFGLVNLFGEDAKELLIAKRGGRDIVGTDAFSQDNVKKFNRLLQTTNEIFKQYTDQLYSDRKNKEFYQAMGLDKDAENKPDWRSAAFVNRDMYDEIVKLSNIDKEDGLSGKQEDRLGDLRSYFTGKLDPSKIDKSKAGSQTKDVKERLKKIRDYFEKLSKQSIESTKYNKGLHNNDLLLSRYSDSMGPGKAITSRTEEELKAFKNNNRSMSVMHNGGEVAKTGPVFAQKGEIIVPKAFADGGIVSDSPASKSLNNVTVSLDISVLKDLKLSVEETKLEVDIPAEGIKVDIPTEGIAVIMPTEKIQVEMPTEGIKVEMPTEGISVDIPTEGIKVEMPTEGIAVIMPTEGIKVDMPTEGIKVDIPPEGLSINNIDEITSSISNGIKDAVSNIEVAVNNQTTAAVGADSIDKLTETVNSINDKIIVLKGDLDGKIDDIQGEIASNNINDLINTTINDVVSKVDSDLNNIKSYVDSQRSNLERTRQEFYYKFDESDRIQREIRTLLNSSLV